MTSQTCEPLTALPDLAHGCGLSFNLRLHESDLLLRVQDDGRVHWDYLRRLQHFISILRVHGMNAADALFDDDGTAYIWVLNAPPPVYAERL